MVTGSRAAAAQPPGATLLERAVSYTLRSLDLVTAEALPRPTPCHGWDLRALLAHLCDAFAALDEAGNSGCIRPPAEADLPRDAVAVLHTLTERVVVGLRALHGEPAEPGSGLARLVALDGGLVCVGGRPLPVGIVRCVGTLEILVHGWDVAWACGHHQVIPPLLATTMLRVASLFVTDADRPARFAAPITPPPGASPGDLLLAYLGRDPR